MNYLSDYTGWDWLWEPRPWEATQRHAWPSQWQADSGTYLVPCCGYTDTHYHSDCQITRKADKSIWQIPSNIDVDSFDFSWHPNYAEPSYEYHFGTQWQPAGGPIYPGTAGVKLVNDQRATAVKDTQRWQIPSNIDVDSFDFSWHPNPIEPAYTYHFGTQWQPAGGPVYPGTAGVKLVPDQRATAVKDTQRWQIPKSIDESQFDFSWHPNPIDPAYTYHFGTQWQKTNGPVYQMTGARDIKYVAQPRATKITKDDHWEIPDTADVDSFDWTWHPDSTEQPYIYQFGTQHQRTGGPRYVAPGATDIKFVDQIRIKTQRTAGKVWVIDHLDGHANDVHKQISHPNCALVRYFDNYLDTLIRIAKNANNEHHEFIWIVSSICDYTNFDFSWHPEQWQAGMLHVFASNDQKFGDTFFMHVPTFVYRAEKIKLLEWYDVNFVDTSVPRWPMPVIHHTQDSQVDAVKTQEWAGPLALFTRTDYVDRALVTVPLWREETKTIVPLSKGAGSVVVPRVAIPYVKTQLYDYPYIDKTHQILLDESLDIVFLSNGETEAEYLFDRLEGCITHLRPNRLVRVENVKGRVASQHAAAMASTTDWYFVVPGKLEIDLRFPWDWQPDRMQQPKHYIFHAGNPVNGLVYGHMAMVAYNKKLVLETQGNGLDFTMEKAHEVVPIISGTANYASSPIMAWRTAFREVLKLKHSLPNVENEYRLKVWLTEDSGTIADGHWSHKGAQDAVEYYDAVKGDPIELMKSYEWDWLASYAFMRRNLISDDIR